MLFSVEQPVLLTACTVDQGCPPGNCSHTLETLFCRGQPGALWVPGGHSKPRVLPGKHSLQQHNDHLLFIEIQDASCKVHPDGDALVSTPVDQPQISPLTHSDLSPLSLQPQLPSRSATGEVGWERGLSRPPWLSSLSKASPKELDWVFDYCHLYLVASCLHKIFREKKKHKFSRPG